MAIARFEELKVTFSRPTVELEYWLDISHSGLPIEWDWGILPGLPCHVRAWVRCVTMEASDVNQRLIVEIEGRFE